MNEHVYNSVLNSVQGAMSEAPLTMSTREIAELTGSTHDNVLKTVRALIGRGVVSGNETPYIHPQNGQTYTEIHLAYRDTMVVVSGYSVELRAKIIDRWQELEGRAAAPQFSIPQTLPDALRLAADLAEEVSQQKAVISTLEPKAAALERIEASDGSMCLRYAAKTLKVRPCDLTAFISGLRWIHKPAGTRNWIAYQDKIQAGYLEHADHPYIGKDGREKVSTRAMITAKGLVKLADLLSRSGNSLRAH